MPLDSTGFVIPSSYTDTPEETQVARDLRALRELLSDPARWCRDALARDRDGHGVCYLDKTAQSWCLVGGYHYITQDDDERYIPLHRALTKALGGFDLPWLNNTAPHREVLALIDKAIEIAKS